MSLQATENREIQIFDEQMLRLHKTTDKLFAVLFAFQWFLGIGLALWLSPLTWSGNQSEIHLHVYAAIVLGGLIAAFPIYLNLSRPGHSANKYVVAIAQMMFSILFIHLSGGRIETHFHVFGSLAFLAFYRDFKTIGLATLITAADHLLRGMYWPESVYGVLTASPLRAFEHSAWVLFEDTFLIASIKFSLDEMRTIAKKQAELEGALAGVEEIVAERTQELEESKALLVAQQETLIASSKMSALGEMAGGVAHEINTPLAVIAMRAEQMEECLEDGDLDSLDFKEGLSVVRKTTDRIAKIVSGLRFFAREGRKAPIEKVLISTIIDDTLSFCREKFSNYGVDLRAEIEYDCEIECRPVEVSQVILNLLNNAFDVVTGGSEKWIEVGVKNYENRIQVRVTDSGPGIPKDIREKIMQPFFTTKPIGKGTGLGLSLSKGIAEDHNGSLSLSNESSHTQFVLTLPKLQSVEVELIEEAA